VDAVCGPNKLLLKRVCAYTKKPARNTTETLSFRDKFLNQSFVAFRITKMYFLFLFFFSRKPSKETAGFQSYNMAFFGQIFRIVLSNILLIILFTYPSPATFDHLPRQCVFRLYIRVVCDENVTIGIHIGMQGQVETC